MCSFFLALMYIVHVVCISARYVYCTCGVYICTLFTLYMWCVYLHVYVHCTCRVYICMLCILYMWCVYLHVMYIVHVVCISARYVYCTMYMWCVYLHVMYIAHVVCISARYVHCTCGVYICTYMYFQLNITLSGFILIKVVRGGVFD